MSAKIKASMKKIDASLTLIAEKLMGGEYCESEALKKAATSVANAKVNAQKAFALLAKPAAQGRKGIVAMANEGFDECMTVTQQVATKAELLGKAIQAEITELEENQVTDEIPEVDFSEDGEVVPVESFDDNGVGEVLEEETIKPQDNAASSGELVEQETIVPEDTNAASSGKECNAEGEVEEEVQPSEEIGELDLGDEVIEAGDDEGDMDEDDDLGDLFDPEAELPEEEEEDMTPAQIAQAKKLAAKRSSEAKSSNLELAWDFQP